MNPNGPPPFSPRFDAPRLEAEMAKKTAPPTAAAGTPQLMSVLSVYKNSSFASGDPTAFGIQANNPVNHPAVPCASTAANAGSQDAVHVANTAMANAVAPPTRFSFISRVSTATFASETDSSSLSTPLTAPVTTTLARFPSRTRASVAPSRVPGAHFFNPTVALQRTTAVRPLDAVIVRVPTSKVVIVIVVIMFVLLLLATYTTSNVAAWRALHHH